MKKLVFFIPAIFYYALIFYFSSKNYKIKVGVPLFDKWAHLFEFVILAILLFFGYSKSFKIPVKAKALATIITGTLFAFGDEIHQYFVPSRHCDVLDAVADLVGVLLGSVLFLYFYRGVKLKIY